MDNPEFVLAAKAMESLEMYRMFYASSNDYQLRFQDVLGLLRHRGEAMLLTNYGQGKFLLAFSDALEVGNQPGEYVPLSKR